MNAGVFAAADAGSEACLEQYRREGWVLIEDALDVGADLVPIHRDINRLIGLKLGELELETGDHGDFIHQADFLTLCRADRARAGEIYRASRHLHPLHRLLVKDDVVSLAARLMSADCVNINPYTAVRIDIPGEEQYLFRWHQDFPYTQGSLDGVVMWIPLFDVPVGEGNIRLIPGSHREGLRRVKIVDPGNTHANGAHSIEIEDIHQFDDMASVEVDVRAGDALVFSNLLVHTSTPSNADTVRWTVQLRYGNFADPDAVRRGWPAGMLFGGQFEALYPEYAILPGADPARR